MTTLRAINVESEAGQLDATELTPDSLTRLSWRRGHLDAGYAISAS